jgi:cytidine deaminase
LFNANVDNSKKVVFLRKALRMKQHKIEIEYLEIDSIEELSSDDANLVLKAREAAKNAWAPYSGFNVGAAVQLENDLIVLGNNQENAAYPSGLCAERVALFAANANYPNLVVKTIAISAFNKNGRSSDVVKPCGSCRQAILETEVRFNTPVRLILDGANHLYVLNGISNLLPLSFEKESLTS